MNIPITPKDEYQHTPSSNPLWREGYYFNGYDTETNTGVSISIGIRPAMKMREEVVTVHGENPLLFLNMRKLEQDALTAGSLQMKSLELLKKWKISMKDSFLKIENSIPSDKLKEVEVTLQFTSDIPVYGYSTKRGDRYEQPGVLKGDITIEGAPMHFEGKGIRDHSWEIRDITPWQEWYYLMGRTASGVYLTLTYVKHDTVSCEGWVKSDAYYKVHTLQVDPHFSGSLLKRCKINVETAKESFIVKSELISSVRLPLGGKERTIVETVVSLDKNGYGFLWYGGST